MLKKIGTFSIFPDFFSHTDLVMNALFVNSQNFFFHFHYHHQFALQTRKKDRVSI